MPRVFPVLLILFTMFVTGAAAGPPVPANACDAALPPRLMPGGEGRVRFTDSSPIMLRDWSHLEAEPITEIPAGGTFRVFGAPFCNYDGLFWYSAEYNNHAGWILEAIGGVYLVEPAGGVKSLSEVLPPDAVLVAAFEDGMKELLDPELSPLLEPDDNRVGTGVVRGDALYVFKPGVLIAHRASGEPIVFNFPSHGGILSGVRPSPDGQRVAWLLEVTDPPLTFTACDEPGSEACPGRDYELYVTEADGTETLLSAWRIDYPYPNAYIQSWIDGQIVLDHRMWGVASPLPMYGGGLTAIDDQTGELTEITPLTDADELISADGRWIAHQGYGTVPLTLRNLETGAEWSPVAPERTHSGEFSFSPSGRYFAYGLFHNLLGSDGPLTIEVWVYDTETGETTLLARTGDYSSEGQVVFTHVSAWLSDDLPVITHGNAFSVLQISTGASVFIDRIHVPSGEDRKIVELLGTLGPAGEPRNN